MHGPGAKATPKFMTTPLGTARHRRLQREQLGIYWRPASDGENVVVNDECVSYVIATLHVACILTNMF